MLFRPSRSVAAVVRRLFLGIRFLLQVGLVTWATLAIHYSDLPWAWARLVLALTFLAFSAWALWLARTPRRALAFTAVFLGVLGWWVRIAPSHDRHWPPEVAVMPRAIIDGDRVRILGYRSFTHRSRDEVDVRYEERDVSLSHLAGLDFFVSYWMPGPVGHTFVSFVFDDAPPVCISIETRPEVGEGFSPIASLFKQFELIYVVGDERDLVGVRTGHRNEDVYLYRIQTAPENVRRLFLVYLDRMNELADRAEFYHLLSNSCTVNIVRYANAAGRSGRLDLRHVLNGLIDRYLYASGRLDTSLPFEELRRRSRITEAAQSAAGAPDFSQRIRVGVPGMPPLGRRTPDRRDSPPGRREPAPRSGAGMPAISSGVP